jgi:hypothetical protein
MPTHTTYVLWGSIGIKLRGETFMQYLARSNLNILSQGNEPTFVVRDMKFNDLTLGANKIGNLVTGIYLTRRLFQTTGTLAFK